MVPPIWLDATGGHRSRGHQTRRRTVVAVSIRVASDARAL